MLSKNKEYIVDIVDIGQGGVGIGKYEGFTVFVDGGLVQDKIKVKITKSKKNYAVGDIVEIIEKSPFRVERKCSESLRQCGGCQIQELDYQKQLDVKTNEVKQVISRIGKLDDVVIHDTLGMEHPFRYRNKAQFPIQKVNNNLLIGFYKKKTDGLLYAYTMALSTGLETTQINFANIENKGQHPSLQIFYELVARYNISVDQFFFPDSEAEKSTQRRQLDTLLDNMSDAGLRIVAATAKEVAEVESEKD